MLRERDNLMFFIRLYVVVELATCGVCETGYTPRDYAVEVCRCIRQYPTANLRN